MLALHADVQVNVDVDIQQLTLYKRPLLNFHFLNLLRVFDLLHLVHLFLGRTSTLLDG
jgi:hypothetical protein